MIRAQERVEHPLTGVSLRAQPANLEAEKALLGALLANNAAFHRVAPFLKPDHFADPVNGRIYQICARRILNGDLADAVTLKSELENSSTLDEVGGTSYLVQLLTSMVGITTATDYARTVYDAWLRRQVIDIGADVVNRAFLADSDGEAQVRAAAERFLGLISTVHARDGGLRTIGTAVSARIEQISERYRTGSRVDGLLTGFPTLDDKLGPMADGDLIYLMAVRGAGKTALALQIAVNVARGLLREWMDGGWKLDPLASVIGDPNTMADPTVSVSRCPCVLFDSYEMPEALLVDRHLSVFTGIKIRALRRAELNDDRANRLRLAEIDAAPLPLVIDDIPGQSAATMAIRGRLIKQKRPIALRITDNIRKVVVASRAKDGSDDYSGASSKWKDDASQWGRHIVLCHPKQEATARNIEFAEPKMSDAPYGIDRDADMVLAIHREEMFLPTEPFIPVGMKDEGVAKLVDAHWKRKQAMAGVAKVIALKNRNEEDGWSVRLRWDGSRTMFSDPATQETSEDDYE